MSTKLTRKELIQALAERQTENVLTEELDSMHDLFIMGVPGYRHWKRPKLIEEYETLFGYNPDESDGEE